MRNLFEKALNIVKRNYEEKNYNFPGRYHQIIKLGFLCSIINKLKKLTWFILTLLIIASLYYFYLFVIVY
jgi:hypothetical protein